MNATATADIADADLDREMQQTPADIGDAPPVPPASPREPEALTWRSRGKWGFANFAPAEVGIDTNGVAALQLKLHSSRNARHELTSLRDDLAGRCRATLLGALQQHPEFQAFAEAHAEHQLARLRVAELEKHAAGLETEKLKLTAKPKGAGPRLVALKGEQEDVIRRLQAARAESEALQPLAEEARLTVEAIARQLSQDTARQAASDHLAAIDAKLNAFGERHALELTEIASMLQARRASVRPEELTTFALNLLNNPEPVAEPATA